MVVEGWVVIKGGGEGIGRNNQKEGTRKTDGERKKEKAKGEREKEGQWSRREKEKGEAEGPTTHLVYFSCDSLKQPVPYPKRDDGQQQIRSLPFHFYTPIRDNNCGLVSPASSESASRTLIDDTFV
jgi:hypothetical protein